MGNTTTVTRTGNFITLVFAGNGADFLFSTDTTANPGLAATKIKIASIMWHPDTDNDLIIIRDGGSTNAVVYIDQGASECESRVKYYGGGEGVWMNPSITISGQCVTLGNSVLIFEVA